MVGYFCENQIKFQLKSTEELSPMALQSDAKFKEKLTGGFKYGMWNLVIFTQTLKSPKILLRWAIFVQSI